MQKQLHVSLLLRNTNPPAFRYRAAALAGFASALAVFEATSASAAAQFDQGQMPLIADGIHICHRALLIGFTDHLLLRAR